METIILIMFVFAFIFFGFIAGFGVASLEIAAYEQALTDLRTDAARVNQENICWRMAYDNYTPNDQIIDECAWLGVDVTKL